MTSAAAAAATAEGPGGPGCTAVELLPLTEAEYDRFVELRLPDFAAAKVRAGNWSEADAPGRATEEFAASLPQGLATPGNHLFSIREPGAPRQLGWLWLAELPGGPPRAGFVCDVFVHPSERRRGVARAALRALEAEAARLGLVELQLHVFGFDHGAQALYRQLGYEVTNLNLSRRLTPGR